ncbi:MAG TPA: hypothetical protein EYP77_01440, partial [Anaerolineae bacterium]|nr:hypothetical protein [Anaerolineae bacterium]
MPRVAGKRRNCIGPTVQVASRRSQVLWTVCCLLLLTACQVPGVVHPTVKIGLVAPFEGRYRYVGYDLFPAVRLALR